MIPGRALHRLATHVCSPITLERIVEPAIADLQKEYARPTGVFVRAWVLVVGYLAVIKVISICALSMSTATADERRAIVRTCLWSVCIVIGMTALLIAAPYYNFANEIRGWHAAVTLVPQAAPLAIPIGLAFGVAIGLSVPPTLNVLKGMLLGAIAASALSFCALVWGLPAGNQAFHEIVMRARYEAHRGPVVELEKGYNEMTLSEMRREIARFSTYGLTRQARISEFRLHLRIALAAATLALVCVLLVMIRPNNRNARGLIAFAACGIYWVLMLGGEWGSRRGYVPPRLGAWLPNIVLIVSAIVVASSRSSRPRVPVGQDPGSG